MHVPQTKGDTMNYLNSTTVYEAGYTIFPSLSESELPFNGVVLWIVFISLVVLASAYMIFNIIYNKIKEKRIKERERTKLKLIISQEQVRSEVPSALSSRR